MIEKRVCSYGYIPEHKLDTRNPSESAVYRQDSKEDNLYTSVQKTRENTRRHARRRAAESRKSMKCSDAESDTSDGFTVNSGGSGRSGDWAPPKMRQKAKYSRKRNETRSSFTDSGISLAKTDSGDLSEISYGGKNNINIHIYSRETALHFCFFILVGLIFLSV